jgi:2-iminobutanoate/2-iminopropanoate deaminase
MRHFSIVTLLFTLALLKATFSHAQQPTTMSAKSVAKHPFSPGLQLGETLYVSGHLCVNPAVGKAPEEPGDEARQVLHSVEVTLEEAGLSLDDLVYVEIYCTDLKLYGAFNKAYSLALKSPYPARDFIGVKDLLSGAHFEGMGIAVRKHRRTKNSRSWPCSTCGEVTARDELTARALRFAIFVPTSDGRRRQNPYNPPPLSRYDRSRARNGMRFDNRYKQPRGAKAPEGSRRGAAAFPPVHYDRAYDALDLLAPSAKP